MERRTEESGGLDDRNYSLITEMLKKVTVNLTRRKPYVRKELEKIMGGRVLPIRGDKEFYAGVAEGREQERTMGISNGIKMLRSVGTNDEVIIREICETYGLTYKEAREYMHMADINN